MQSSILGIVFYFYSFVKMIKKEEELNRMLQNLSSKPVSGCKRFVSTGVDKVRTGLHSA